MAVKIIKKKAKEIFTKTKLPGCDWVINQYVGCEHACTYCYAKFICRWKKHGDWGTWVEVKINAPELVKGRFVPGWVFMSSISDPYQPIEKELKLTRKILENMNKNIKLSILTKSDLILRDIDILKKFKRAEVGLTINSFNGEIKKIFEPNSPGNEARIKTLKELKKNGMKTYAFVSPIIPNLIDLEDIISKTKDFSDYYWFEMMNLRGAGKEFSRTLKDKYPKSYNVLINKQKLKDYIAELKKILNSSRIKVRGIEIH